MKRMKWFWMAVLVLVAAPSLAATTGNVNIFLGQKNLDESDWASPYDEQGEFGILFDVRGEEWPVSLAVDLLGSARTVSYWWGDATASTSELDVGVRQVFEIVGTSLHPYLGGGVALASARYEETDYYGTIATDAGGMGIWLNGGLYVTLGSSFNLGLDLRHSQAQVTMLGRTVNAGGSHVGLVLGYHW